jgi:nitrogen fixation NifU-like protein
VTFDGAGCAISKSSASIMTTTLKGKTINEAKVIFEAFHHMVTSEPDAEIDAEALGKLQVFSGVREYPIRIKCATLAWHALVAALDGHTEEPVTTE